MVRPVTISVWLIAIIENRSDEIIFYSLHAAAISLKPDRGGIRRRGRTVVLYIRIKVGMVRFHLLLNKLDMVFHFRFVFSAVASACCRYVN